MPRFFFDTHDGTDCYDPDGTDLPDLDAARRYALKVAATYTDDPKMLGTAGGAIIVEVHDAARVRVLSVRLAFDVQTR